MSDVRGRIDAASRGALVFAVRLWAVLWAWAYPPAGRALDEALASEIEAARGWRLLPRLALFAVGLPLFARAQATAERSAMTRTARGSPPSMAGAWVGRLRAALVWATLAGWVVAFALFVHAEATTGRFAPDYAPSLGAPEVISVQFHLAALVAGVPTLIFGGALGVGWLRGRRGRAGVR